MIIEQFVTFQNFKEIMSGHWLNGLSVYALLAKIYNCGKYMNWAVCLYKYFYIEGFTPYLKNPYADHHQD